MIFLKDSLTVLKGLQIVRKISGEPLYDVKKIFFCVKSFYSGSTKFKIYPAFYKEPGGLKNLF